MTRHSFAAEWLALRESADRQARNPEVLSAVAAWCCDRAAVKIADLGSGTGANLRAFAPALDLDQAWTLYEQDAALLDAAESPGHARNLTLVKQNADLRKSAVLETLGRFDLVTASALLDLVSETWLDRLLDTLAPTAALYITLSVDGCITLTPEAESDALVRHLFNDHQAGDKGFGPALGAKAPSVLCEKLMRLGYQVKRGASPWRLGPEQGALQCAMIEGWVQAALEQQGAVTNELATWRDRRLEQSRSGKLAMTVGHQDIFAWR